MESDGDDKKPKTESTVRNDLEKISGEVLGFLDRRYPLSMNILRNVFSRNA